jgi:hypothetical protein
MDKNIKVIASRVYYSEGMRELGAARFVLGGVILLFGVFFIWIELYIPGILISVFAIVLMEHCSETIIDKENRLLIKKTGWIKPFLTVKRSSIAGADALSIDTVSTKRRNPGSVVRSTSISYKLYFEMPGKKLHINTFTEKTKATAFANEISKLLDIEFIKTKAKSKTPEK